MLTRFYAEADGCTFGRAHRLQKKRKAIQLKEEELIRVKNVIFVRVTMS
jgi:hypothetical protein